MTALGKTLIVNDDTTVHDSYILNQAKVILTYGLSLKSTITASSIDDGGFLCCIQRGFFSQAGTLILPQEFHVRWRRKSENIYPYLETVTLLLVLGTSPKTISENIIF